MLYEDENKMVIGELWHEHEEDDPTVECALCGEEVDEETTNYGICEKCWAEAHTIGNAERYGKTAQVNVSINGFFAELLTPAQIDEAIREEVMRQVICKYQTTTRVANEFLRDDDGDFADWLKEQKENE